ncbi:MAG: DUF2334 domain-containing protein [Lachnospiraceae bacterium]|nr:DUF2334 domain-containing protein [Lachnospiraceae bacterium]
MRIGVRLDDIAPEMNRDAFERMIGILKKHQALPLLGVIPDCRDEKIRDMEGVEKIEEETFWDRIRELRDEGAVIAMHGCHHVYTTTNGGLFPLNRQSEFAGLPFEEQMQLLKEGLEILKKQELSTEIFMAPAHSYDDNTLKALKECGFKQVTDGFGREPYRYRDLTFYPLALSKKRAAAGSGSGSVTIVYHVNTMKDADFDAAEALFDRISPAPWKELMYEPTGRRSAFGQKIEFLAATGKRLLVSARGKK